MKMLFYVLSILLIVLSGCSPNQTLSSVVNNYAKQEPGWSTSGHTWIKPHRHIKVGEISSELIYFNPNREADLIPYTEDTIKEHGFIFGFYIKAEF